MYHEGWWGAWYNRLPYLAPFLLTLIPSLAAFRWPIIGGSLIAAVGVVVMLLVKGQVGALGLVITLMGVAFIIDGITRQRKPDEQSEEVKYWWLQNWRQVFILGLPLIIIISISANMLPVVLARQDDGFRGALQIEGNGVTLVWAPEGPGWNWKQEWGGFPSWQSIALYGMPPVGLGDKPGYGRLGDDADVVVYATEDDMRSYNLCRYLSANGMELMDTPQDIWRMPTAEELVVSLVHHGDNAGCHWDGLTLQQADCAVQPDKESPLWATDQPVIYYWAADSYDEERGVFVSFNGWINATQKTGGNPRHSYRCVRDP